MREQELKNALNQIEISEEIQEKILQKSKNVNYRKGEISMKSKKRLAAIAVAATFILGMTVFASTGIITSWCCSSSSKPDYTSLPTAQEMMKDVGYSGALIEAFENGYAFRDGSIVKNALKDDSNQTVEKFKSLTLRYEKGENTVNLSIEKFNFETPQKDKVTVKNEDIDIYAHSFIHKIVPENYVKTEEESAAESSGELMFEYDGEDHIVESNIISVSWKKDGVRYNLMQRDGELSVDELIGMANEIIEYK